MPKPICVSCQCFYRVKKNGYYWTEMMPDGSAPPRENIRGQRRPDAWTEYKIWSGDMWECPDCNHRIVVGAGAQPVSEHYKTDFMRYMESLGADQLKVNDC